MQGRININKGGKMESTIDKLNYYFEKAKSNSIEFVGYCYDCGKEVTVKEGL